ncbi:MAG: ABC transporter substrate-binding protein [Rhodobacteraceae bacterium]|jgi:phospholipid transport system substrate-binding protein|nr:ABC transporter substrate-binding protein [Paracoccaceae bacterium]
MMNDPDRRLFLGGGLAACLVATAPMPVLALTDAGARQLVDRVVADINKVIASGKPLSSMIRDFERIFSRYADVNIIARSTLGQDSRRASSAQMRAFTAAFQGYIARKYGKRFQEFSGGRVEVQSVRKTKSWHEVKSQVILRGQSPFEVLFLVSDRSGRDLFFDMIIEGVSLRLSERTEIGAMLDRRKGNIDALIADLKQAG